MLIMAKVVQGFKVSHVARTRIGEGNGSQCVVCREMEPFKGLSKGLKGSLEYCKSDTSVEGGQTAGRGMRHVTNGGVG